jgi:Dolichyl-phosphate-mannose-protein mannosyltransferase
VLATGLGLRLWGIRQGLPYTYNLDEADHFVPRAVRMFEQGLNPRYFANPPAYTYLLHIVFAIRYGGGRGTTAALIANPTGVYTLARLVAALLGVLALWLLYLAGARLISRTAGLLAAAIEAVAFLPVFYAHLALNDVPTLAPLTLSLLGSAGVLRKDRARDHALAGIGLGLACATKYTAGIVLVPYLVAVGARYLQVRPGPSPGVGGSSGGERSVVAGGSPSPGRSLASSKHSAGEPTRARARVRHACACVALTALVALAAFLIANPYAILDFSAFHRELAHQSSLSAEAQGKLGAPRDGGFVYYLWTLTWGLGWIPALAALGGALTVWRRDRALGWMLVTPVVLYLALMGLEGRYFGRWLLPVFPLLCLLAALFAIELVHELARRAPRLRVAIAFVVVLALLAQGLVYSLHSGLVLSRADTRSLTRQWMVAHIPAGTPIVVEPVSPDIWGERWNKYPSLLSRIAPDGALETTRTHQVGIENYELTLSPALLAYYQAHGYCWIVSGSSESGRAYADPHAAPLAIAYYRALARTGQVVYRASPYARGQRPVPFDFDWSFDYYPLAYTRPGPSIVVYRLHGGPCARQRRGPA